MTPICNQDARPSLRPGAPGGSEDCFSRAPVGNALSSGHKQLNHGWQEEKRRSGNEGMRLSANRR